MSGPRFSSLRVLSPFGVANKSSIMLAYRDLARSTRRRNAGVRLQGRRSRSRPSVTLDRCLVKAVSALSCFRHHLRVRSPPDEPVSLFRLKGLQRDVRVVVSRRPCHASRPVERVQGGAVFASSESIDKLPNGTGKSGVFPRFLLHVDHASGLSIQWSAASRGCAPAYGGTGAAPVSWSQ